MRSALSRHKHPRTAVFLAASLLALLIAASGGDAAVSCLGKQATIVGGGGDNVIHGTKAPDVIYAGGGNDTIYGEGGNDRICGGPGDDTIDGNRGSDHLAGDDGDDTITGYTGNDTVDGGSGDDEIHGWRGSDDLDGGDGTDRVFGDTGNDTLDGGPGNGDYVDGGQGDEKMVSGGPGDFDVALGDTGVDRIDGGPGEHDVASYATSSAPLTVNLGTGTMTGAESEHLIGIEDALGGSGNDTLVGDPPSNRLDGGPGDDHLQADGGGDDAFGGPGSDSCTGGFASENSCGPAIGGGNAVAIELLESIDGTTSFIVAGTGGPDLVTVQQGNGAYLAEGSGGTRIVPGSPEVANCTALSDYAVSCTGEATRILAAMGDGNDTLSLSGTSGKTNSTLDGGDGSDDIGGGLGHDVIYAGEDDVPDTLSGDGGDDVLFGLNTSHPRKPSGAATMFGGGGNDLLIGGQPCDGDSFDGGPGPNDSASFARVRNSGIVVRAQIGGPVSDPNDGSCAVGKIDGSIEKVEGSTGPDELFGDGSANTLLGRGGDDLLNGEGGHDRCIGGGGHDTAQRCEQEFSIP